MSRSYVPVIADFSVCARLLDTMALTLNFEN